MTEFAGLEARVSDLEAEFRFWRNYAALLPYTVRRPRVVIPAQRRPFEDRWDVVIRRGLNTRPNQPRRA